MRKLEFNSNEHPTLGIELELGLVDARTWELSSSIHRVLELLNGSQREFKSELMQCCVEINTGICEGVSEAEEDLR
ncbi:MAG: glutamate-cysteine ligase family protein, partial [Pirellulaceae bacterium]